MNLTDFHLVTGNTHHLCDFFIYRDTCREDRALTVFTEDWCGDEVLEDPSVSVERTNHLTPNQEFTHLLCQLPQFLL